MHAYAREFHHDNNIGLNWSSNYTSVYSLFELQFLVQAFIHYCGKLHVGWIHH